jgi:superfamily I DNA/RNA helicase
MEPTSEQHNILDLAEGQRNLQINASAGTGKTSTIKIIDWALDPHPRLYLAFNKRVVEEMKREDEEGNTPLRSTTEVKTLNGLGHGVWAKAISSRLVLNTRKITENFKEFAKPQSKDATKYLWDRFDEITTAVAMAKALGFIPTNAPNWERRLIDVEGFFSGLEEKLEPAAIDAVDGILRLSIRQAYAGNIDFNDQLYMPALFGGSFPNFPLIFIDEAQDLSPVNVEMLAKMKRSRLIAVGDPAQSIYGFRGAMTNGMGKQADRFAMLRSRLSVSFRCPSAIVENARWRVPDFKWFREGGKVAILEGLDPCRVVDGSAFICRNNAPLFRLALNLLSVGRSVSMAGTDIGPKLLNVLRRLGDESISRSAVFSAIDAWQAKRPDSKNAADFATCLRLFANLGTNLSQAIAYAEHILNQDGQIHLSTGHKAKGMEWPTVYHLDPWLIGDIDQEQNLRYVIQTRAKEEYYEIKTDQIG